MFKNFKFYNYKYLKNVFLLNVKLGNFYNKVENYKDSY